MNCIVFLKHSQIHKKLQFSPFPHLEWFRRLLRHCNKETPPRFEFIFLRKTSQKLSKVHFRNGCFEFIVFFLGIFCNCILKLIEEMFMKTPLCLPRPSFLLVDATFVVHPPLPSLLHLPSLLSLMPPLLQLLFLQALSN